MKNNLIIKDLYIEFSRALNAMKFSEPVARVYNPLEYAFNGLEKYLNYLNYFEGSKRIIFLGMNPGTWGMAQTGVPFGEVEAVKNFLRLTDIRVSSPECEHELYKIRGLECPRNEVSGKRLWGLFEKKFGTAEKFFSEHFVLNYCPLLFLTASGEDRVKNLTPDKIKKSEQKILFAICDEYLRKIIEILKAKIIVGVGNFAETRAAEALKKFDVKITKILHPSPASPQSNKDWDKKVIMQLINSGVWES